MLKLEHTNMELVEALADQRRELGALHDQTIAELKQVREGAYKEIERLRAALLQIGTVCDDNASVGNIALALKFVREIVAKTLR